MISYLRNELSSISDRVVFFYKIYFISQCEYVSDWIL